MKKFKFEIRGSRKEDLKDVVKFLKRLGSENVIHLIPSEKFLLWKYRYSNLLRKRMWFWIVRDGEKVVGISGSIPIRLFTPKGITNAMWESDVMIEQNYRKYPFLFLQLIGMKHRGWQNVRVSAGLTFPFAKEVSKTWQKVGWLPLPFVYNSIFRINKNYNFNTPSSLIKLKKINYFDKKINFFFKRVSHQYDFIICRNRDYLNWRYFRHPFYKYKVIIALKNERILGYIVFRKEKETKTGYILDILGDLNYPRHIYFLVFKALRYFKEKEVRNVYCLLTHKKYISIFRKIGFYPYEKTDCLIRFIDTQLQNVFIRRKNWHLTLGDGLEGVHLRWTGIK